MARWRNGSGGAAVLAAILAALCLAPAWSAEPVKQRRVDAEYLVTWLGLPVYTGRFQASWNDARYRLRFDARPEGIARLGSSTTVAWETRGRLAGALPVPGSFVQHNTWRKQTRTITLAYGEQGPPTVSVVPPESPGKRPPVPDALKAQTLDPLSALFAALAAAPNAAGCTFGARVFEGLRRTDIRLEAGGMQRTPEMLVPGLPREALYCRLHAKRLAGYEDKHFRANPEPLPPAELWIVKHPESGLWVVAQLRFDSAYGPVYARLLRFAAGQGAAE